MPRLIVNADDFGYSKGVTKGIVDAHTNGIVNSTTMMVNMPYAREAAELAKKNPRLAVGIHLVLTCGKPLRQDVPSLINENGLFQTQQQLINNESVSLDEVEREWREQIEQFLSFGLTLNHIDSHHHVHTFPKLQSVVKKLANEYNVSVRRDAEKEVEGTTPFSDLFFADFYADGVTENYFVNLAKRVTGDVTVEIMSHPAYVDELLQTGSSYCHQREKELEILTKVKLPSGWELVEW